MKHLLFLSLIFGAQALLAQTTGTAKYLATFHHQRQTEYTLDFNQEASVFYAFRSETRQVETDTVTKNGEIMLSIKITEPEGKTVYRHIHDSIMVSRYMKELMFPSAIIVEEKLPVLVWELLEEGKMIGKFECYKAITQHKGRTYHAWFTYDVPVSHGPWQLGGLPGLIMEVYDSEMKFHYVCTSIEMPSTQPAAIVPPTRGKKVTWDEYVYFHVNAQEIVDQKIKARLAAKGLDATATMPVSDLNNRPEGPVFVIPTPKND